MKKLLIISILFLLTGCESSTFTKDPSLKESERIAVLEKAKYDTLTIAVEMDESIYLVKDNEITEKTNKNHSIGIFVFVIFMAGFILGAILFSK